MQYWAVLVGINAYTEHEPLHGCVRDVRRLEEYLKRTQTSLDVEVLTAESLTEPAQGRPTYENVTAAFNRVIEHADHGDSVHLHFSGHGSRVTERRHSETGNNNGDLALVLVDNNYGERYFYGLELAQMLQKMVARELKVTLVLDCCFSGAVLRTDSERRAGVRFAQFRPEIALAYPPQAYYAPLDTSFQRHVSLVPTWLVDPDGYTILAACGPHEIAQELTFLSGEKSGALSHFLIETLLALARTQTFAHTQTLYQNLCSRFRAAWPSQTPMLYGKVGFAAFGSMGLANLTGSVSILAKDGRSYLEAGKAHGVCVGDQYEVSPFGFDQAGGPSTTSLRKLIMVKIAQVQELQSEITAVDPSVQLSSVKTGWVARFKRGVGQDLPEHTVDVHIDKDIENIPTWVHEAYEKRFVRINAVPRDSCIFTVQQNDLGQYEIVDNLGAPVLGTPAITSGGTRARENVLDLLEHLAVYKVFERIENRSPSATIASNLGLRWTTPSESELSSGGALVVRDGETVCLHVRNNAERALFVHIYILGPLWDIENLFQDYDGRDFMILPPKKNPSGPPTEEKLDLKMEVPEVLKNQKVTRCQDVVKIFASYQTTFFTSFTLSELSKMADHRTGANANEKSVQLARFLRGFRDRDEAFRGDTEDVEWIAINMGVITEI